MAGMFQDTGAFNQPLAKWHLSSAEDLSSMFTGAKAFNQPLNSWDVSHVKLIRFMFCETVAFNQPLGSWKLTGLDSPEEDARDFLLDAAAFNQPPEEIPEVLRELYQGPGQSEGQKSVSETDS